MIYPRGLQSEVCFEFGKGWLPKLLGIKVAFDWIGFQGSNLVKGCRVSGAINIHVGASVCLSGCLSDGCK